MRNGADFVKASLLILAIALLAGCMHVVYDDSCVCKQDGDVVSQLGLAEIALAESYYSHSVRPCHYYHWNNPNGKRWHHCNGRRLARHPVSHRCHTSGKSRKCSRKRHGR